jgi:lipoprotein-releasing system ATP-binding protein
MNEDGGSANAWLGTSSNHDSPEPRNRVALPLEARSLVRTFVGGNGSELRVLQGVDLRVQVGEAVSVTGASGAGKSTLLHLLGALDRPTSGEVFVDGRPLSGLDDESICGIRNHHIGFVFQFHHLLREFTALENVSMPRLIAGHSRSEAEDGARHLLESVGLGERLHHKPWQLSGGEQQRVAVARALANDPVVLLADEPSGNLDYRTSEQLHDLLFHLRDNHDLAMVLVTHNRSLAVRADRVLRLENGILAEGDEYP